MKIFRPKMATEEAIVSIHSANNIYKPFDKRLLNKNNFKPSQDCLK